MKINDITKLIINYSKKYEILEIIYEDEKNSYAQMILVSSISGVSYNFEHDCKCLIIHSSINSFAIEMDKIAEIKAVYEKIKSQIVDYQKNYAFSGDQVKSEFA